MSLTALTEEERLAGLKTLFDPSTLVRKGLCPVSKIHNESSLTSHSLYYEQHGRGPEKIVFIMGLNNSAFAWEGQVKQFAKLEKYSLVVFDNRGVGNSDTPKGPYSTSTMAEDVVTLVDYLGWKEERQLHIVGISLGGMISLELATMIPQRIASLSLIVTTPGHYFRPFANLGPIAGMKMLIRTMGIKDPKERVPFVLPALYPQSYLDAVDPEDPDGLTHRETQIKSYLRRIEYTRPQGLVGSLSQMCAALFHYVSPARLSVISSSIPKILILGVEQDDLVDPSNSRYMSKHMPQAEFVVWKDTGHGVPAQWPKRTAETLQRVFEEGRKKAEVERGAQVTI